MYENEKGKSYESKRFPIEKKHSYKEEEYNKGGKEKHHDKDEQACVEEVLEAILKAQRKVEKEDKKKCSSCKESIHELLEEHKKPKKDTIPFILYCGCDPFKATGVTTDGKGPKDRKLDCVTSFIFKIKDLKGECAELELLTFKSKKDDGKKDNDHKDDHKKGHHKKDLSLCEQIDHEKVEDLEATGICINVDLSCFCGITCLPAVRLMKH